MQTVMVPLDGSALAESILPLAVGIAKRLKSKLSLVHVASPSKPSGATSVDFLDLAARTVRIIDPAIQVDTTVLSGHPGDQLSLYAEDSGARLVVITTHGHGGVSRLWLGSVAEHIVRNTTTSVLLVRPDITPTFHGYDGNFKSVLIPLDGTPMSSEIISVATQIAGRDDVGYTLFRVIPVTRSAADNQTDIAEEAATLRKAADRQMSRIEQAIWANGFDADSHIRESDNVAQAILRFAYEGDTDLIAMASHGPGGVGRAILGSVSDKILRGANVPVLIRRVPSNSEQNIIG